MELDERTQKFVDGLINKRVAEIKNKHEKELAAAVTQAEAKALGEIDSLKAAVQKHESERMEYNERIRRARLESEISRTSAVNVPQVQKLLNDYVRLGENDNLEVIDDKGVVRLDEAGRPLSVKTYLEGFLHENPHLAKAAPSMGSGSFAPPFEIGAGERIIRRAEFDKWDPARKNIHIQSGGRITD